MSCDIITGDCVEELARLAAGSVRLLFADPPYNIGKNYGPYHNDKMPPAEYLAWCERWIGAAVQTLAPDGSLWLLCSEEYAARLQLAVESVGIHWRQRITFHETFGTYCTHKFGLTTRALLWMVKDPDHLVFNADAVRVTSKRQKLGDRRGNPLGKIPGSVWRFSRVCQNYHERVKGFPTQLPRNLLRRVVRVASNPGDLVVDPFNGTGTTGVVCRELHRNYLGVEINPGYAARARKRLSSVTPRFPCMT
jgi:site-specific DNA-methyltransferase (adenine-specific)